MRVRFDRQPLAVGQMSGVGGIVLQKSFCITEHKFPSRRRGDRIIMWGTTSSCDELTGDFGGAFEAASIDDCSLFRLFFSRKISRTAFWEFCNIIGHKADVTGEPMNVRLLE